MKESNKGNIVLIGMSGAGKSTLGVLLAKALGMDFLDSDILIQQSEKRLLQEIIDADGTAAFLAVEENTVCSINTHNCVIATGGSVVYSERAMSSLKSNATTVYLSVEFEALQRRISNITTRGIVYKHGGSLREIFEERLPLYKKYADITLDCTDKSVEYCVERLVELIVGIGQ